MDIKDMDLSSLELRVLCNSASTPEEMTVARKWIQNEKDPTRRASLKAEFYKILYSAPSPFGFGSKNV